MTDTPIRGCNPEPDTGWPWCLTEYEIQYILAFGVRPRRNNTWVSNERDERSLDQEAQSLLQAKEIPSDRSAPPEVTFASTSVPSRQTVLPLATGFASQGSIAERRPYSINRRTYSIVTGVLVTLCILSGIGIGFSIFMTSQLNAEAHDNERVLRLNTTFVENALKLSDRRHYDIEQQLD